jgi:serine O-acetyltransferase
MNAKPEPMPEASALADLTEELRRSYLGDERGRRISRGYLPSREAIVEILTSVLDLMYPGYFGRQDLSAGNLSPHLEHMRDALLPQLGECAPRAHEVAQIFLHRLPQIRALLIRDVQAAFDGDPAALNLDEIILAYPGVLAVSVYRIAHALYDLGVPMMARIMTEWAHSKTGCDIHPGATIGAAFFIDHATGVVIGETTHIGAGVKIYQGVTLGALSLPRDANGHLIRGKKRHPTVEDGATLYANATVLGGQTVVGAGSVIGGSVFLTRSVPPRSRVSLKEPELRVATRDGAAEPDAIYFDI